MNKIAIQLCLIFILGLLIEGQFYSQNSPLQSAGGPGGSNYSHNSVVFTNETSVFSGDGYWLFEPNNPKPDSADLVVFNHGYGVFNPGPYGQWIEHLVRKGNIVVFPKYQTSDASLPSNYTPNAITGILSAIDELQNGFGRVRPRMEHFAIIGHSYGGVITSNLVTEYALYGTPKPQCFMLCQPGTGGFNSGRIDSYSGMDSDYNCLIVVGDNDAVVGDAFGREIMDSTLIPVSRKNFITHYEDDYGNNTLLASHNEPLATNNDYDGGTTSAVIIGAYTASVTDAIDYYCYWKLADALLECTFYGTNCNTAFGDTDDQRFMGTWSDGNPVIELEVEPDEITQSISEGLNSGFIISPNPTNGYLSVYGADVDNKEFLVYDVHGKLLKTGIFNQNQMLDLQEFKKGIYILQFRTEQGIFISKNFIVE